MALTVNKYEDRRNRVIELYRKGTPITKIGPIVGVTNRQIYLDMAQIRQAWRQSEITSFAQKQEEELRRLDEIEALAMSGYEDSLKPIKRTTTTYKKVGRKRVVDGITETVETSSGNPAYLEKALKCIRQRCELLGLLDPDLFLPPPAPTVVTNNTLVINNTGGINKYSPEQIEAIKRLSAIVNPPKALEVGNAE